MNSNSDRCPMMKMTTLSKTNNNKTMKIINQSTNQKNKKNNEKKVQDDAEISFVKL